MKVSPSPTSPSSVCSAHPEDVGELAEADGFELADLHAGGAGMRGRPQEVLLEGPRGGAGCSRSARQARSMKGASTFHWISRRSGL